MNNKIIISIISFILCVLLFFVEISFLMLYSVRSGIKRDNIVNIINDIPVVKVLENFDEYKNLESFDTNLVNDVVSSDEMNYYIKENLKAALVNSFYHDNVSYVSGSSLLSFSFDRCLSYYDNDSSILFLDNINRLIEEYDLFIQDSDSIFVASSILSSSTINTIFVISAVLILFIIILNRSYNSLLWLGIPTLFSGFLFFVLSLLLGGTLSGVSIDVSFIYFISKYFSHLIIKMRFLGMIFFSIGCCLYVIYFFIRKGYVGVNDGKN